MPSFDEMLKDMPMHYSFYLRGVANSLLPAFMNPMDREVTEKNISGEALELLRYVAENLAPDLADGEVFQASSYGPEMGKLFSYDSPPKMFQAENVLDQYDNIDNAKRMVKLALGSFGITKQNGQYVIFDIYDFNPNYREKTGQTFSDAVGDLLRGDVQSMAQEIGQRIMPDTDEGMKIHIRIPNEPSVINVDYDDDIPEGAEDFVFRGPMTNKRKSMFDAFTSMFISEANAGQVDNLVPLGLTGQQTRDFYENYAKQLTRDGAVPAMGSAQMPLSPDTDTSFLDN